MLLYTFPQLLTRVAATAAAAFPAGARDTYVVLLRGIIGCSGPQPDAELVDGSAMALTSTSFQHPEYKSYEDLRNSMIEVRALMLGIACSTSCAPWSENSWCKSTFCAVLLAPWCAAHCGSVIPCSTDDGACPYGCAPQWWMLEQDSRLSLRNALLCCSALPRALHNVVCQSTCCCILLSSISALL
jgi:hypothetical protein